MKKLIQSVLLTLLAVAFTATATVNGAEPIKGVFKSPTKVVDSPVKWSLTAVEKGNDIYELTFTGDIKEGYHGYPLSDMYSAPVFDFDSETCELVGDMRETEPTHESVDEYGDTVHHYYNKMVFIQDVKVISSDAVAGQVNANLCLENQCNQTVYFFEINLPCSVAAVKTPEVVEAPKTVETPEVVEAPEVVVEEVADEQQDVDANKSQLESLGVPAWSIEALFTDKDAKTYNITCVVDEVTEQNKEAVANTLFIINNKEVAMAPVAEIKVGDSYELKSSEPIVRTGKGNKVAVVAATPVGEKEVLSTYDLAIVYSSTDEAGKLDWGSIITAILWGFAALLTPCVFPMVPMTVSFFIKGSQSPAQGRFRATMYGFFIIALYVLPIAALVIISNVAGGTNVTADIFNWLSTHWVPNIIFFLIFMIFAASFFGAFEITMPSKLVNKSDAGAEKGGLLGIFFMALTLVLVSFSCTGPIVGTVLISSTQGGDIMMPIIVMFAFAFAFALPFTLLAWFPSMLKNMPKSGGWLNSVKVVLGFIEIALGLKFLMTADQVYHWGLLDREIYLAIWIVVFTLLGLYFLGKIRFAHDDKLEYVSVKRLALAIVSFAFVVYLIPGMFGAPLKGIAGYLPPMKTQDFRIDGRAKNPNTDKKFGDILEIPHSLPGYFDLDDAIEAAKKENKPLFIDVTGHGCNNCREMEARVWSDERVMKLLEKDYIICALYVDDKTKLSKEDYYVSQNGITLKELGTKNLTIATERWGAAQQPAYVLLTPDGEEMLASSPLGYETDIDAFVNYLKQGLDNLDKDFTYPTDSHGVLSAVEVK